MFSPTIFGEKLTNLKLTHDPASKVGQQQIYTFTQRGFESNWQNVACEPVGGRESRTITASMVGRLFQGLQ